ncbi:MAG: SDR family oxidoreductase [Rhizomicrobium sp.]
MRNASPKYLVTGATGNLGGALLQALVENTPAHVVALVRPQSRGALKRLLAGLPAAADRVSIVEGDVRAPLFGLQHDDAAIEGLTDIVHAAANVDWRASGDDLIATNLAGAENCAELANLLIARGSLERCSYISTAYAGGIRTGTIAEEPLRFSDTFSNRYEMSKFLAERIFLDRVRCPVNVIRPTAIVGDSRTGTIRNFSTLYYPFKLVHQAQLSLLPARPDATLDIVPLDFVVDVVMAMHASAANDHRIVHAAAGSHAVTIRRLWELCAGAFNKLDGGSRPLQGIFVPPGPFLFAAAGAGVLPAGIRRKLRKLALFIPYITTQRCYATAGAEKLGLTAPAFETYVETLCRFAVDMAFGARTLGDRARLGSFGSAR